MIRHSHSLPRKPNKRTSDSCRPGTCRLAVPGRGAFPIKANDDAPEAHFSERRLGPLYEKPTYRSQSSAERRRPVERVARFPSSDGMSTAQGIRADPFSESPIRPEVVLTIVSLTKQKEMRW